MKLLRTQLSKIIQLVGFLGRLLRPLLKTSLPLMKHLLKPLAKSVLLPLGHGFFECAKIETSTEQ